MAGGKGGRGKSVPEQSGCAARWSAVADQNEQSERGQTANKLAAPDALDLHRVVREEGEAELERPFWALCWSGIAAGIAINASLLTEAALHHALPDAPWRDAVASIGYPIGFLLVILGRLQLFTESTITAMLPLATTPSWRSLRRTARLWAIVIAANLVGTALSAAANVHGLLIDPALRGSVIDVARKVGDLSFAQTLMNAVPAGFLIAMIAWILPNARRQSFLVIAAITYVVSLGGFSHSIVGSDEAFVLMFAGVTDVGRTFGGIILPALIGNLIGGAGIFALLAHAQVRSDVQSGGAEDAS